MGTIMDPSHARANGLPFRTWFLCLFASGLFAIHQAFFTPQLFRIGLYVSLSIPVALLSILALGTTLAAYAANLKAGKYRHFDAALAIGISLLLLFVVPGRTSMEADESLMISTAQSIYHNFSPYAAVTGIYLSDGTLIPLDVSLDKRGVLFPLLIAGLDWLLGPDVDHRLYISWAAGIAVLFLTLRLSRRFLPASIVPAVAVFLVAMPVFTVHARSGTFDTLNVAVILLMIHSFLSFIWRPSFRGLGVTLTAACMAGQIRNESILLAGIATCCVLAIVAFSPRFQRFRSPVLWLAPWALAPAAIRRAIPFDNELPDPTMAAWSVANFQDNFTAVIQWIVFGGTFNYGNAIVGLAAMFGFAALIVASFRRDIGKTYNYPALMLTAGPIVLISLVLLFYAHGRPDTPVTARYFMLLAIFTCMIGGFAFTLISERALFRRFAAMAVGFYAFWVSSAWSVGALGLEALPKSTNSAIASRLLSGHSSQCDSIIVSGLGVHLLVRGFSAMGRGRFEALDLEKASGLAGRKLGVIDLTAVDQSDPIRFAEEVRKFQGGSCDLAQRDVVSLEEARRVAPSLTLPNIDQPDTAQRSSNTHDLERH